MEWLCLGNTGSAGEKNRRNGGAGLVYSAKVLRWYPSDREEPLEKVIQGVTGTAFQDKSTVPVAA